MLTLCFRKVENSAFFSSSPALVTVFQVSESSTESKFHYGQWDCLVATGLLWTSLLSEVSATCLQLAFRLLSCKCGTQKMANAGVINNLEILFF